VRVYLVHHAHPWSVEQDPKRHLSEKGRGQAGRVGTRLRALGAAPVRILHSDSQYTADTAMCVAAKLSAEDKTATATYPIKSGDSVEPFMAEIAAAGGDIMMCGHFEYLERAASRLVCRNETRKVVAFKPGNGTTICIEGEGDEWVITYAWRQDHAPG
jgi:phosphohistidine phosphatase SixA